MLSPHQRIFEVHESPVIHGEPPLLKALCVFWACFLHEALLHEATRQFGHQLKEKRENNIILSHLVFNGGCSVINISVKT